MAKYRIPINEMSIRCSYCQHPYWFVYSDHPVKDGFVYEDDLLACQQCDKTMPPEIRKKLKLVVSNFIDPETGHDYLIRGEHSPNTKREESHDDGIDPDSPRYFTRGQ